MVIQIISAALIVFAFPIFVTLAWIDDEVQTKKERMTVKK